MIVQKLYKKYLSNNLSKTQFLAEIKKYPDLRGYVTNANTFDDVIKIFKNKRLLTENIIEPNVAVNSIQPLDFNRDPSKEVHVIKFNLPDYIQFIHNDSLKQIEGDDVKKFIDVTYDGGYNDKDDLDVVTDCILHHQDALNSYAQYEEHSLEEIDAMKQSSSKLIKIGSMLRESLTYSDVNDYEYKVGFSIENVKIIDPIKCAKKVLKNLESNSKYYTDLISNYNEKTNLKPQKVTDETMVDKLNPIAKVKTNTLNESSLSQIIKNALRKQ
jgi:uncharacterized protein YerC